MALRIRRGTNAQRTTVTLDVGEIAYTTDSKKLYVGDGITAGGNNILSTSAGTGLEWNSNTQQLDFVGSGTGIISVSADPNPQLGGNLSLNGNDITGTGNINTTGTISTSQGLGSNLNLNSNNITGTGDINIAGVITSLLVNASSVSAGTITGSFNGDLAASLRLNSYDITGAGDINISGNVTATTVTGTTLSGTTISGQTVIANEIQGSLNGSLSDNLDLNGQNVIGTGNINITGSIVADSLTGDVTGNLTGNLYSENLYIPTTVLNTFRVQATTTGTFGSGNIPYISLQAHKGTNNIPTSTATGDVLTGVSFSGYYNGDYKAANAIISRWSSTAVLTQPSPRSNLLITTGGGGSVTNFFQFTSAGVFSSTALQATATDILTGSAVPFADAAARDAKISIPQVGMICYVENNGSGSPRFQGYISNAGGGSPGWVDLH